MEISRPSQAGFTALNESQGTRRSEPQPVREDVADMRVVPSRDNLRLDRMQQTLREMPDVDDARIAEIRRALGNGEISADARLLASSIVAYHRGSDV
jgi:negative regulator of flagellin synthesis FlgM